MRVQLAAPCLVQRIVCVHLPSTHDKSSSEHLTRQYYLAHLAYVKTVGALYV